MGMTMTSAEFKCLRESMSLTTRWLAEHWNVSEVSVKRWERNRFPPEGIEQDLRALHDQFLEEVRRGVESRADCRMVPRTDRYPGLMPSAWRRAVAMRVQEQTGGRILFTDDEQYPDEAAGRRRP